MGGEKAGSGARQGTQVPWGPAGGSCAWRCCYPNVPPSPALAECPLCSRGWPSRRAVVAQGARRYRACWARTWEQGAERRLGGRPRRAVGGGGAQEAAPLGQWGVSELSSADGLECGRGRCPDAYGQGREGGGTGPHARESSRGRTRRRSPGDRGRPQGAVGWHRPWALTRGLGSGPRSWGAGLEAGTGSLGQRALTSVPPQGPQLRRLCVVSGSASRLGGPRPTMTPLTW